MIKNYLLTAVRNIYKQKLYSFINVIGLSVGITCTILILLYINDELSYDKHHSKSDRIYRVIEHIQPVEKSASLPFPVAEALKTDYSNYIEEYVRFFNLQASSLSIEYAPDNEAKVQFNESRVFFADSTLLKVFDFQLKIGNPEQALNKPMLVLITESTAIKYFGNEDAIGKVLSFEGKHDITVSGILEDTPQNSHFKFDFIISFSSLNTIIETGIPTQWYWNPCWTYILFKENTNPETLQKLLPEFVSKNYPQPRAGNTSLYIQPLEDIHLYSALDYEIEPNSDISLVYIFLVIAFFILVIAVINFINLSTARSIKRAKEVGVRKVLGASPKQLVGQFLSESLIFTLISVIISVPLVDLFLPGLNNIALKEISFTFITSSVFWMLLFFIVIFVGIAGGVYPSLFLASFKPVNTLTGKINKIGGGVLLRKILVVSQFAVSGILIIGTIVTFQQINHIKNANLGFNKEEVLILPIDRSEIARSYDKFRDRVLQNNNIKSVTVANMIMGTETNSSRYTLPGIDEELPLNTYWVLTDFGKTLGMTFLAGRDLSTAFADTAAGNGGVIVNESFVKFMNWGKPENAIGKKVTARFDGDVEIKGVVKDFHFASLKESIAPMILLLRPVPERRLFHMKYVYVRVNARKMEEVIPFIEKTFNEIEHARAFSYSFLNEKINLLYNAEDSLGKVATVFSVMAIFVACLGLFGLSSFTAEQRTKEIGIRKVVGASVGTIVMLLSKQFLLLVAVANIIAWPVAYYLMNLWLSNFQTQTKIDLIPFVTAAIFTFVISFATISFQAIKAAQANPIKSLKYE